MWQFWIDVGGTFTDCIGINSDGELAQFKTLSSGRCRGSLKQRFSTSFIDSDRSTDPPKVWQGDACRLLSASGQPVLSATVVSFESTTGVFSLNDVIPVEAVSYELDPKLPAPVLAIRWLLGLRPSDDVPAVRIRFGTTRGTNALLTRTGARTLLLTTKGFADVPVIGNQDRPELFDLNIRRPEPLFSRVVEINERVSADGEVLQTLNADHVMDVLQDLKITPASFESVAICLINAYVNPDHEELIARVLNERGFSEISRSTEVSSLIRFVPRCDTTVLDAYLNPILREYLEDIRECLPGSEIQVMTSTGGLVSSQQFV